MREVEKSEGNYMSERPIGNEDRTEQSINQKVRRNHSFLLELRRRKKAKKKNVLFSIHEVFMLLLLLHYSDDR